MALKTLYQTYFQRVDVSPDAREEQDRDRDSYQLLTFCVSQLVVVCIISVSLCVESEVSAHKLGAYVFRFVFLLILRLY